MFSDLWINAANYHYNETESIDKWTQYRRYCFYQWLNIKCILCITPAEQQLLKLVLYTFVRISNMFNNSWKRIFKKGYALPELNEKLDYCIKTATVCIVLPSNFLLFFSSITVRRELCVYLWQVKLHNETIMKLYWKYTFGLYKFLILLENTVIQLLFFSDQEWDLNGITYQYTTKEQSKMSLPLAHVNETLVRCETPLCLCLVVTLNYTAPLIWWISTERSA